MAVCNYQYLLCRSIYIKILTIAITLFSAHSLWGQSNNNRIEGRVISSSTKQGIESVSVILMDSGHTTSYGFCITDNNGSFGFERPKIEDISSLELLISGFNIEEKTVVLGDLADDLVVEVEQKVMEIQELVVKAESERIKGDTISYLASSYKGSSDRVVGDILRRIPGLNISQSGIITYGGEQINKFYVEDMDLLGGRYAVAVNTISADDIASVEVYEEHQPVAALRGIAHSNKAALNIRLKESAKGTLGGSALVGAGVDAQGTLLGKAGVTGLYFSRQFQTIATYKTNNTGEDIAQTFDSEELSSSSSSLLGVVTPSTPPFSQERYLRNNSHTATINSLVKLPKDWEFVVNASWLKDQRYYDGNQNTLYQLPDGTTLSIGEQTSAALATNRADAIFTLRRNNPSHFINNQLHLFVKRLSSEGVATSNNDHTDQWLLSPQFTLADKLQLSWHRGNWSLTFNSSIDLSTSSEQLSITPLPFEGMFEGATGLTKATQYIASDEYATNNSLSASYALGRWSVGIDGTLNASRHLFTSTLAGSGESNSTSPLEYRNDIHFDQWEAKIGPSLRYSSGNNFWLTINLPLRYVNIVNCDLLRESSLRTSKVAPAPHIFLNIKPWNNIGIQASVSHIESFGSLYDSYAGGIMQDYRHIGSMGGVTPHTTLTSYTSLFSYNNIFKAVSASLRGGFVQTRSNVIYNTSYDGVLINTEGIERDTKGEQWFANTKVSKRFKRIHTTLNLTGGINYTRGVVLIDNVEMDNHTRRLSGGVSIISTPIVWAEVNYSGTFGNHTNILGHSQMNPINTLQQQAQITISLSKLFGKSSRLDSDRLNVSLAGQHFHNGSLPIEVRNIYFADASIGWRGKQWEWMLRAHNLLNYGTYSSRVQSANTDYSSSYALRPRTFIAEMSIIF